jgi:hypothetical protein
MPMAAFSSHATGSDSRGSGAVSGAGMSKTDPARGTKPGRCVRLVSLEPVCLRLPRTLSRFGPPRYAYGALHAS